MLAIVSAREVLIGLAILALLIYIVKR